MWIGIGNKLINLEKVEMVSRVSLVDDCEGKTISSYQINFYRPYTPGSNSSDAVIYRMRYETEEELDIKYEEIKKLLIKNKTIEIY